MTRISYSHLDNMEVSNLMMTNSGKVIFVEIEIESGIIKIKEIEGECLFTAQSEDLDKAKRIARDKCIELGVFINDEIREKK
jgi:hypothetical protein